MSRGHGVRQRALLNRLVGSDERGQYVTPGAAETPTDAAALRRAAYQLEHEGLLQLRVVRGKLAMFRPDVGPAWGDFVVMGADGRTYRSTYGQTRAKHDESAARNRLHRAFLDRYAPIAEKHGHPQGPGILLCVECAEAAGADAELLDTLRESRRQQRTT